MEAAIHSVKGCTSASAFSDSLSPHCFAKSSPNHITTSSLQRVPAVLCERWNGLVLRDRRLGSSATPRSGRGESSRVRAFGLGETPFGGQAGPWSVKNDYPEDYVLYSNDEAQVAAALKDITEANRLAREQIARATATATAAAEGVVIGSSGEVGGGPETVDVTRPRAGAIAPVPDEGEVASQGTVSVVSAPLREEQQTVEKVPSTSAAPAGTSSRSTDLSNAELARRGDMGTGTQKTDNPISIVFVSSEVAPYSKTGGLADVVGALPLALAARGHRVMVVAPRYMNGVTDDLYASAFDCQCRIKIGCFSAEHEVAYFHEFRDGVDFVFVDHPAYHRPGGPYGDTRGAYGDNQFRFTLLCYAACEAPLQLALGGFTYGENVVFVANDWHAGLVPVLVAAKYRPFNVYRNARSILAIHNLAHQGVEPGVTYGNLGLPGEWYGALEWVFPQWARAHALDKGEAVNILKGAVVTADRILTVSPGYAWEITTLEGGWGLDSLLRSRSSVINGITNGVDIVEWNPATDRHIPSQFSAEDLSGKPECKAALQKELGLPVRPEVPLIGFVGRLDHQKGPDIIQGALQQLMSDDVQFVMLGSGDPALEAWMGWAEANHKDKFRGWVGFSVPVAHRITAGCDILLMPSRFEPCGLNQLYAMRYGTVPVAHCTGGLRDTIQDFNPFANGGAGAGTGWTFSPLSSDAMLGALWNAIATYRQYPESWRGIMLRGMQQDMSWERAASQYEQVFAWALVDPPYA
eukprot:TRINITY_DN19307_c0_g1_i1.p1 TRINITY_DN19307_c0_g1~~TRINITY_DN19307_c0_g1_i1.p1  ORF type:complete len:750 (-),score=100.20 TRINITY_DN19307_c0_g1_i1:1340-3589(-)